VTDFLHLQQPPDNLYHSEGRGSGRFVNDNDPVR